MVQRRTKRLNDRRRSGEFPTTDEAKDESSQNYCPACERQPIADAGIKRYPRIDRNRSANDGSSFNFLRLCPGFTWERDDLAIGVDDCRDSHIDGPHDTPPRFDCAELTDCQMLFVLLRAAEPTVVGDVHKEIDILFARPNVL